jgi:hypothetical protein
MISSLWEVYKIIVGLIFICSSFIDVFVALGDLVVIVLAIRPRVRGFKPGQGRSIIKGDKNPKHDFLQKGCKAVAGICQSSGGWIRNDYNSV